jgi:ATP/maltotriose-dependent transcriptional regulator MalT
MCVRDSRRTHGVLYVFRAEADAQFQSDDLKMLASIAGYVAHGMTPATLTEEAVADAESDDRALFVVDRDGKVRHADAQARRLMMMALLPYWSSTTKWHELHGSVPQIRQLCRALAATGDGQVGQPPPVSRFQNRWGTFILRAYWFGPTDGSEQTRQIAITIERRVPRALAVRRRIENLPLTGREKQLCLLLVQDPSRKDLADAMGVAISTIVTHQHSIYDKLGVYTRAGLLAKLQ